MAHQIWYSKAEYWYQMSQDKLGEVALVSSAFKLCIFSGIEGDFVHFEILAFEEKLIPIKYDVLAIY